MSGLEAVIMLRAMDAIGISQTIGRVIRLHKDDAAGMRAGTIAPGNTSEYTKSFGLGYCSCVQHYSTGRSTFR